MRTRSSDTYFLGYNGDIYFIDENEQRVSLGHLLSHLPQQFTGLEDVLKPPLSPDNSLPNPVSGERFSTA